VNCKFTAKCDTILKIGHFLMTKVTFMYHLVGMKDYFSTVCMNAIVSIVSTESAVEVDSLAYLS